MENPSRKKQSVSDDANGNHAIPKKEINHNIIIGDTSKIAQEGTSSKEINEENEKESKKKWLNNEFFEIVIKNDFETKECINIKSFSYKAAVKNGENYSSNLYRVQVTFSKNDGEEMRKSYIVKEMFSLDTAPGQNLKVLEVFEKEVCMYSETLISIENILKSIGIRSGLMPRLLHWTAEPQELLVLEDLVPQGFVTPNRQLGLDKNHCELALTKLGQMHAASIYLNRKDPTFRSKYNKSAFFEGMSDYIVDYFVNGVLQAIDVMKTIPECGQYVNTFTAYADLIIERGIQMMQPIPPEVESYNVLNHGDFWLVNMLFKYDESGTPVDVKFVDFQMSTFHNPGLDLNYFFFTSVTDETRARHRDNLLGTYHSQISGILAKLGHPYHPKIGDLNKKLKDFKDIAIMSPCIVLPIAKLDKDASEEITTEKLMQSTENDIGSGLYGNPLYREALKSAVLYLAEIGYISKTLD